LDQAAAQGCRGLLILAGEVVFADGPADVRERDERFARRVQRLVPLSGKMSWTPDRLDRVRLVGFGDRREAHHLPWLLPEHVADQVVLVQPLHDDDDAPEAFVVETAVEG